MADHELRIRVIGQGGQQVFGPPGSGSVPQQAPGEVHGPWPIRPPQGQQAFGPPSPGTSPQPVSPQPVPPARPPRQNRVSGGNVAGSLASIFNNGALALALTRYQAINRAIGDIATGMERAARKRKRDAERLQKRKDRAFRRMNRTRRKMGLLPRARRQETRSETFRRVVKEIGQDAMNTRAGQFVVNSPIGRAAAAVRRRFVPATPNFNVHGPQLTAGMARGRQVSPGRFTGAINAVRRAAPGLMQSLSPSQMVVPALGMVAAAGAAAVALKMFTASVERTAERIGNLAPQTATAMAQRDARQIMGDMRRAQLLDRGMAGTVNLNSRISQDMQDIKAVLMKAGLEAVGPALEVLAGSIGVVSEFLVKNADNVSGIASALWDISKAGGGIAYLIEKIGELNRLLRELLVKIGWLDPEKDDVIGHWIDELMKMELPGQPAAPPAPAGN